MNPTSKLGITTPFSPRIFAFAGMLLMTAFTFGQTGASVPKIACGSLAGREWVNVKVTSAAKIAAKEKTPAYCDVRATENGAEHDIQVLLPDVWSGRLFQQGGGGFDGRIPPLLMPMPSNPPTVALQNGAIVLGNNGGYRGGMDMSGEKLLNNPQALERYAHKAIKIAKQFGNALAGSYYGSAPKYSYYAGCSNGGRGAANAAAKYGDEYDGVISGAPGLNIVGMVEQWTRASALDIPDPAKLKAVGEAEVAKCDLLDGVKDGIISNWEACKFDPIVDAKNAELTPTQALAMKALESDLKLKNGTIACSGLGFGDKSSVGRGYGLYGAGHMRNIILNDAKWSPAGFEVDTYDAKIRDVLETKYAFNPEAQGLISFLKKGKKMIVWHGSADGLISHRDTVRVWQQVTKTAGADASANARLYIASGVDHCAGGPGADSIDLLTPLMNWVEKGVPPGGITATKFDRATGKPLFTRPLCTYPLFPKYKGSGDVNDAANFTCAAN